MKQKPTVLFETEGSYPYAGGGVSTWAHILCSELETKVDFILLALTGTPEVEPRYPIGPNIRSIMHIPLWGLEEPVPHFTGPVPFSKHIERKHATTDRVIKTFYFPLFRDFVSRLLDPYQPADEFGEVIYGFWKYFQHFDYKKTLSHPLVWEEFRRQLRYRFREQDGQPNMDPAYFDVTFGVRWLYHFMLPLAAPVPDVTVTHSTIAGFPSLLSIAARYEYGIPSLLTDHGVFIRERLINVSKTEYSYFSKQLLIDLATFVTRGIYHHADRISPVTTVNKKWEKRYGAEEERIEPIYNGVDTDVFKPTPKPDHTQGQPTVVAVAHLFPLKDIETMIRCCDLVRRQIPDVQFNLYGSLEVDPIYTRRCKGLVEEMELEENFNFGGYHSTPSMVFNEGDISILSSISEGFPYTVIESMSCARPVVATDVGGIREALEGCGILCKPRDPGALAEGVIELLQDDAKRVQMGRKARDRVLLKYTIEKSVHSYLDAYRELSGQQRTPLKEQVKLESVQNIVNSFD